MFRSSNNNQDRESTPLIPPSPASGDNKSTPSKYYFLNRGTATSSAEEKNNDDRGEVFEAAPEGTSEDEFAPRVLSTLIRHPSQKGPTAPKPSSERDHQRSGSSGLLGWLFGGGRQAPPSSNKAYGEVGTLMKLRKAPIKIEPKVFFANERTFLAWMHLSVILAGASIAILAFAQDNNPYSQLYGVVLLPVAISFIIYSMYQYTRRASMIRHRHPGPYEDTVGPTVLGVMLMVSIVAQFAMKLYSLSSE